MSQLEIDFDRPAPFQKHSDTSRQAAHQIRPNAGTLRAKVLDAIKARPSTDEELQHACDLEGSTERPRRVELLEAGLIEDSGEKRKTTSGRLAVVWRARP